MKRIYLSLLVVTFFYLQSCENEASPDCIEVQVITHICGNAVLEVISGGENLKLSTWTSTDGQVYTNVIGAIFDSCDDNLSEMLDGSFFITIAEPEEHANCIVCLAIPSNMPEPIYPVKILDSCDGDQ
ncbi:hypothetical protein [Roseivirga misakiensis]|uniref:GOLD domain-containing protein n=1 Tax=Roseivirga misakiensis TaxID=1563681 RepID=A0A1E5T091_9BACT|nr:hypothetical protein [Roseivirga misakiensis]OEK04779.1 hypothetical protein BFP71_15145 [Roseivirga misakiensis]